MTQWNQTPVVVKGRGSITDAVRHIVWKVLLATALHHEFAFQSLSVYAVSAAGLDTFAAALEVTSFVKSFYQACIFITGIITTLWLFSDVGDLASGVAQTVRRERNPAASREPDNPIRAPPQLPSLPDTIETPEVDVPYQRRRASPYQRTASPYSTIAHAASPEDMLRMQQQFSDSLSQSVRRTDLDAAPTLMTPLTGSAQGTPGSADWALPSHVGAYLSPPAPYQYQQLPGTGALASELPKYHYSLQWSSGNVATSNTLVLHPSAPRAVDALLRRLMIDRNVLRVWAEKLRVWTSEKVMRPLLRRMASAGKEAAHALQTSGAPVRIMLPSLVPQSGDWTGLELPNDDDLYRAEMTLNQLRDQARPAQSTGMFGGFGVGQVTQQPQPNAAALAAAAKALHKYRHLCKLLRGDYPNKGILGNCPPGYLASRIAALGADSACGAFKWKAGGSWQGRDWTADLPSDTHVLLYMLGAFFSAPFWRFEDTASLILGAGGPLCVGELKSSGSRSSTAILASKPNRDDMNALKAAMLLLSGSANEPLIMLVLDGQPTVTLCGEWAAFEKVVLFLAFIKVELDCKIGPFSYQYLELDSVLEDVPVETTVRQRRWLGILT